MLVFVLEFKQRISPIFNGKKIMTTQPTDQNQKPPVVL